MTIEGLIEKIKEFEGFRSRAYDDMQPNIYNPQTIKGTLTIGYGRTSKVKLGDVTTKEIEDVWLNNKVRSLYNIVNGYCKDILYINDSNESDRDFILALTDFTYNCGISNLYKLCSGRNVETIVEKIVLYNKAGGKELPGLTKRRKWEQDLMNGHVYDVKENRKNEITLSIQKNINELITEYEIEMEYLTQDGIYGAKTEKAINTLLDIIK